MHSVFRLYISFAAISLLTFSNIPDIWNTTLAVTKPKYQLKDEPNERTEKEMTYIWKKEWHKEIQTNQIKTNKQTETEEMTNTDKENFKQIKLHMDWMTG